MMNTHDDSAIQTALELLRSRNPKARIAAVETLARHHYTGAIEHILVITQDANITVREAAIWALGDVASPIATERLRVLAERPQNHSSIRAAAIYGLGRIGDVSTLPGLFEIDCQDYNVELQEVAERAILNFGDSAVSMLLDILNDRSYATARARQVAARILGRLGATRAIQSLVEAIIDDEGCVGWTAIKALGDIGDPAVVPFLVHVLTQGDWRMAEITVWALDMLQTPEAIAATKQWRANNPSDKDALYQRPRYLPPSPPDSFDF